MHAPLEAGFLFCFCFLGCLVVGACLWRGVSRRFSSGANAPDDVLFGRGAGDSYACGISSLLI